MSWPVQPPIRDNKLGQKSRLLWTVLTKLCVQLILNRRNNYDNNDEIFYDLKYLFDYLLFVGRCAIDLLKKMS